MVIAIIFGALAVIFLLGALVILVLAHRPVDDRHYIEP